MHFEEITIKEVESIISHQDRFIVLKPLKACLHLKVLTILQLVKTHFCGFRWQQLREDLLPSGSIKLTLIALPPTHYLITSKIILCHDDRYWVGNKRVLKSIKVFLGRQD